MISYLGWKIVREFTYKCIKFKKNKSLVRGIDRLEKKNSAWYHRNIKVSKYISHISSLIFVWSLYNEYTVYYISMYTGQTVTFSFNDYSKIETLFSGDWSFCWSLRSVNCWWIGKRFTGLCWSYGPTFWGQLKKLAAEKAKKMDY